MGEDKEIMTNSAGREQLLPAVFVFDGTRGKFAVEGRGGPMKSRSDFQGRLLRVSLEANTVRQWSHRPPTKPYVDKNVAL